MRRVFTVIFMMLTLAGVCRAEWIEVRDDNDVTVYIDDDIQKTDAGYWVWKKWVFKKPQLDENTKKRYDELNVYGLYSSDFRKYCGHQETSLYRGNVVDNGTFCRGESEYYPHDWENIAPGSVGAAIRDGIKAILRGEVYYDDPDVDAGVDVVEVKVIENDSIPVSTTSRSSENVNRNGGRQKINVQRGHYYIANVKANSLNLRNGAGSNYEVAYKVNKGARVVVSGDDLLAGGFGMVLSVDGSKFGYASVDYLEAVEELGVSAEGALEEVKELTYSRTVCDLVIKNTVRVPVTINFAGRTVQIPSGETRKLSGLTPGRYDFVATAKGFSPFHSVDVVKGGHEYRFVMYVKTIRVK